LATTPQTASPKTGAAAAPSPLQEQALRHLWMHFTPMGTYGPDHEVPIIVRGEGCYVWDEHGDRKLDGLSALFCVNAGHGRTELGEAMAEQVKDLGFYTNWTYAHPRAIELAVKIAELAPGDLNRVFFTSGGSESVESAWKMAREYHKLRGDGQRTKIISREIAYHGTTLGALAATGITPLRTHFEPLTPGGSHVPNTNTFRLPPGRGELWSAEAVKERIEFEGPETIAAVIMEPVQNAGGCFTPPEDYWPRVREICDEYGVLLISDEVICSWGRIGHYFGCERYGYLPDIILTAKGITSAYAPMGAVIASDKVAEPFMENGNMFTHGLTFGGHPVSAACALKAIEIYEREDLPGRVREKEGEFKAMLDSLRDLPIVGDVRGAGFFYAIELVKDHDTMESFDDDESHWLLKDFLSGELYRRGLICRADDRGDPVIQLSPPLIADSEQFEEMEAVLRPLLREAWDQVGKSRSVARRTTPPGSRLQAPAPRPVQSYQQNPSQNR
jgi:adenosylmethionine-8-amino-7-oxononanoate aminotransferase